MTNSRRIALLLAACLAATAVQANDLAQPELARPELAQAPVVTLFNGAAGEVVNVDPIVGAMRHVPAGTFMQGSPDSEPGRRGSERQFEHTLTRSIAVMETAVSRKMWADLLAQHPSLGEDPSDPTKSPTSRHPVQRVSWGQAVLFANLLSASNGLAPVYYADRGLTVPIDAGNAETAEVNQDLDANGYRLPLEAEREYAARAGSMGPFPVDLPNLDKSNSISCDPGVFPALEGYAWFCANAQSTCRAVGGKAPNAWGLKDMHGNVWEWCWDLFGTYPSGQQTDYTGNRFGTFRVYRGGAWAMGPNCARSAFRGAYEPGFPNGTFILGFRLVRTLPAATE